MKNIGLKTRLIETNESMRRRIKEKMNNNNVTENAKKP
jgi:hypothetical protein